MKDIIKLMRPIQWTKNLFVFVAIVFAGEAFNKALLIQCLFAFATFCVLSSSVYVLNDIIDKEKDASHPTKKNRPIASGKVSVPLAVVLFIVLTILAGVGSVLLGGWFALIAGMYFAINIAYSLKLKNVPIIDIMSIASGFVLRTLAGAVLIQMAISPWLVVCAFFLSLFLAIQKRSVEIGTVTKNTHTRFVNQFYTPDMLRAMSSTIDSATIIAYTLYTFSDNSNELSYMMLTIPMVIFGIFRYQYIIHASGSLAETPEYAIIKDKPLLIDILLWAVLSAVILYLL